MPIYDYMTPFEQREASLPEVKRSKLEKRRYSGNPPVSPASYYFDISASNHPGPFNVQAIRPASPNPVLLRHEMPGPSHNSSTDSAGAEKDRDPPPCYRCGPIFEQSVLHTQANDCCVCVGIAHEREGRSAQTPGSVDMFNPRCHALQNHRHRQHSLFDRPIQLNADKELGPLGQLFNPLEQESTPIEVKSEPLEEECNRLEADSKSLEYEAMPLEEAHGYEDPYYPGAEERLSGHRVSLDDWDDFCRVQKARSELWLENEKASSNSTS